MDSRNRAAGTGSEATSGVRELHEKLEQLRMEVAQRFQQLHQRLGTPLQGGELHQRDQGSGTVRTSRSAEALRSGVGPQMGFMKSQI